MDYLKTIAYCGLNCSGCPIYWAASEKDLTRKNKIRSRIAAMCNETYGLNYTLDDINDCNGCRSDSGLIFKGCADCEVRNCAKEKSLETCANCQEYACSKLEKLFVEYPSRKECLETIRAIL